MSTISPPPPSSLQDFAGQQRLKGRLEMAIDAAKIRQEVFGHVLFVGPVGVGKATLANVLAKTMGVNIVVTSGPALEKAANLAGLLTKLDTGDILFIAEIHRLSKVVEEYLRPAMEDFRLDLVIDQGSDAHSVRLNLPRFTVIGSTTTAKQVAPSLLPHFSVVERFDYYGVEDLAVILRRAAEAHSIDVDNSALMQIAQHADGTPRAACNLLQHVRDFALARRQSQKITVEVVRDACEMLDTENRAAQTGFERTPIPKEVRTEVWRRDGGKCIRCGSRVKLEFDHIVPVSKGGSNTARNIELLCEECNRSKGNAIR